MTTKGTPKKKTRSTPGSNDEHWAKVRHEHALAQDKWTMDIMRAADAIHSTTTPKPEATTSATPGPCHQCEIRDGGTFKQRIVFCPTHALAPEMRDHISDVAQAMEMWADDIEEAGYPERAEALRWQAQRARALLARLDRKE